MMKKGQIFVLILCAMSCKGQVHIEKSELVKHINENTKEIEYKGENFNSTLKLNYQDSALIYQSPMASMTGRKYVRTRNQIKMMPFENLHPQGIYFSAEQKLVKIYPRDNKPGFFDNITSRSNLRWSNQEYDSDVCVIRMNNLYDSNKFNELRTLYGALIEVVNSQIPVDEIVPKEGIQRPEYKNYRNRILNINSSLEMKELVLPIQTVEKKPYIQEYNFKTSLQIFEREMRNFLKDKGFFLEGNLRGYILIDKNGKIVEVLQEESDLNYSRKNLDFEQHALNFNKWNSAEYNKLPVICKVKYYIQKRDWD